MNAPNDRKYTKTHEWILEDGSAYKVGITDFAQHEMGDIVYVNLPEVGATLDIGGSLAEIESVKAVSEVYSPIAGEVLEVNDVLTNSPEKINEDAFGAWIAIIKGEPTSDTMNADEYAQAAKSEH